MGTRADFYVGSGKDAKWLGSIAWDGYPCGIDEAILTATTEQVYIDAVNAFISQRKDGTLPEQGWPWPWNNSRTTDYAYLFVDGKVMASDFGCRLFDPLLEEPEECDGPQIDFPDMTDKMNITFGKRSGVIVIG